MGQTIARFPELSITAAMLALVAGIGWFLGVPISLPEGERAAFVGLHYLYPLAGVAIWALFALVGLRRNLAAVFLIALPCYAVMLVCHFNLKLWRPLINPTNWDPLFWQTDQALRPLVDASFAAREAMFPLISARSDLYLLAFIAMFYVSFCYHAVRSAHSFRALFLAALIFQGLGGLSYLIMPALGPFLYERGVEPLQSAAQAGMLSTYRHTVEHGAAWIVEHGGRHVTAGLGAMPSLHAGGAFLFLLFAWRHAKPLVPPYLALFGFIMIDAVASRWHYVIDLPVGLALAGLACRLGERLDRGTLAEPPSVPGEAAETAPLAPSP